MESLTSNEILRDKGLLKAYLSGFQQNCNFRHVVVTGTLSWLVLVFTNFGAFIQYLAECKVTSPGTSHHYRLENTNHATYCCKVDSCAYKFTKKMYVLFLKPCFNVILLSDTSGPKWTIKIVSQVHK